VNGENICLTYTPDEIRFELHQLRADYAGSFLLVEGETDCKFYKKYIDKTNCMVYPAYGKEKVLATVKGFEDFKGLLAIVDADFLTIEGKDCDNENIIFTDTHDLETLILYYQDLEDSLIELIDEKKMKKFEKQQKCRIIDLIMDSAEYIGLFVWISNSRNLSLNFKNLNYTDFIGKTTLNLDLDTLFFSVRKNSMNKFFDEDSIKSIIIKLKNDKIDRWHVCRGHDIAEILSIGLKHIFGLDKKECHIVPDRKNVEKILRTSFDSTSFKKTKVYYQTKKWELSNAPFLVLKNIE
jgi:hypothetical protein